MNEIGECRYCGFVPEAIKIENYVIVRCTCCIRNWNLGRTKEAAISGWNRRNNESRR